MECSTLRGRSILITEDEPLIALDAQIIVTSTIHHALVLVEHDGLSAAVLDHAHTFLTRNERQSSRGR
jgi:hypothetical protein